MTRSNSSVILSTLGMLFTTLLVFVKCSDICHCVVLWVTLSVYLLGSTEGDYGMTIYTPQELADQMQKRIAEGFYQPDQKMVVTIWIAKDVRSPPSGFQPGDPRIIPEEKWAKFVSHIDTHRHEDQLNAAQSQLLDEWLTEWEVEHEEDDDDNVEQG
jgi:hypothetical protein